VTAPAAGTIAAEELRLLEGADLAAWREAQRFWDASVALRTPLVLVGGEDVAYIDLGSRETRVNLGLLERRGVRDRLLCVLAHEVGHHIRHPHTLLAARRMQLFVRTELPALVRSVAARRARPEEAARLAQLLQLAPKGGLDFLVNLFLDVLINRDMAEEDARVPGFQEDFVALYRALVTDAPRSDPGSAPGPTIAFYFSIYQALWYLPHTAILSPEMIHALERASPTWREDGEDLVCFLETHRGLPMRGLAKMLVAIAPFLLAEDVKDSGRARRASLEGGDGIAGELDPADAGRLLEEDGETRAARRILARGDSDGEPGDADSAPQSAPKAGERPARKVAAGFPGGATLDALKGMVEPADAVIAWYRSAARRITYELPGSMVATDDLVIGPTALWEADDDVAAIDWRATLLSGGVAIPGVTTRRRTYLADDPVRGDAIEPWIELYVDSSGSMPDPQRALNPQTLAGFALVDAAVGAGGRARVLVFSGPGEVRAMPEFSAAAAPAHRGLLKHIGRGTMFPFPDLAASIARHRRRARVFRVLLSDADFLHNVFQGGKGAPETLEGRLAALGSAARAGDRFVALLVAGVAPAQRKQLEGTGIAVVALPSRDQLYDAAHALGRRLFAAREEDARGGARGQGGAP